MGTKVCGTKCTIHVGILEKVYTVIADNYCDLWSWGGSKLIQLKLLFLQSFLINS
jgi:hypothetical protein